MKKKQFSRFLLLSSLAILSFSVKAQTIKDFFNNTDMPLLYMGIDFTKAKLIDDGNANVSDIRDRQYTGINELIITEAKKFDIKGAFRRSNLDHDLGEVNAHNEKADKDAISSTNTSDFHRFKADDVQAIVKSYDFKDKKGLALLFVAEALNKSGKAIALWATIVDIKSKKILMTERVEGKLGMGFGFRNYWATAIKSAIERMDKDYKEWKTKYGA